ncbi:unnamed protein product [Adineta steineri]|uniref:Uncharacterized protein n=1 Tax=Adineta steineri TaxID=433720 RepID=A0A818X1S2_9BILA|nr:unnamed protein product [Adineta steineri]
MSLQEPELVDVVIVGSGPTGLMLACQLSLHGVKFRIFDKCINHTTQSRALGVHARSMEIFQQMGIADEAINHGEVVQGFGSYFNGVKRMRMDMNLIKTQNLTHFPFILILEQSKTEALLEEFLLKNTRMEVDRQCELISFIELNDKDNLIECVIKDYRSNKEGKLIKIHTKFLCGCDGAHSKVRQNLQLSFSGNTYEETLYVLDCHLKFMDTTETESLLDDAQFNLTKSGLCLLFPLKGHNMDNRWRVIGTVPHELLNSSKQLQFEDIAPDFSRRIQRNIELYDPLWLSIYRTHHRYADRFYIEKKYFLLGDAAHIHSPVGGQGMNTGLQDAFNLAWKLAYTIQGKTVDKDKLLQTYNDERIEVAKNLVQSTDRVFSLMTSRHWFFSFFRLKILPYILQYIVFPIISCISSVREAVFKRISMIGIHYRQSQLSMNSNKNNVQAGDRLPYVYTHPEILLSSTDNNVEDDSRRYFHLLVLLTSKSNSKKCFHFVKFIEENYSHLIKLHEFEYSAATKEIFRVYDVNRNSNGGIFLVRPDLHIAYYSKTFDIQHFNTYFSEYFLQKSD